jgi:DNA-binding NarL/FixJ family response regulator
MDIEMPIMNGLEATILAKAIMPHLKVLMVTMLGEKENYTDVINAGAMGFVLKTSGKQELERAIKTVIGGESYFSNELLRQIIRNFEKQPSAHSSKGISDIEFTDREIEILRYFCKGMTAQEIALVLYRSIKTIEAHRSKLLEKTHTKNTINLILFAFKHKLATI